MFKYIHRINSKNEFNTTLKSKPPYKKVRLKQRHNNVDNQNNHHHHHHGVNKHIKNTITTILPPPQQPQLAQPPPPPPLSTSSTLLLPLSTKYFILTVYLKLLLAVIIILSCIIHPVCANRPPKFLLEGQSEIVLRLKEGPETPVGSKIYTLRGHDPDGDPLTFGLRHSYDSDIIKIENSPTNNEAIIYLNKELDRETKDEYSIVLTLTDNQLGDGNFVTQSMLLLVEDINDNEPIFKPYQSALEVPENSPPGILTTLEATDLDEGAYGQVVYYLQELEGDNDVFSIVTHHGKGTIRLVKQLDYEKKNLYQLRVLAVDRANQGPINTGTAALLVKVKDVEDQPPVFSAINPVTRVSEDSAVGSAVLQIKAHDGDRGINNPIKYSISKGGDNHFAIDENSGLIYTIKQLDREDSRNQENGAYILEIIATERSKIRPRPSVKTEITVIITDVNDETPTFHGEHYEAEISESAQENTPVTFIGDVKNAVYDYDQGNNGTFELFLQPEDNYFDISPKRVINEATFLIRVKENNILDYEQIQEKNYTLVARELVKDNPKWSAVPIRIFIKDSNDNFPEFDRLVYEFGILENSGIGTIIGRIQATDRDSGKFGTRGIRYTGLSGGIAHLLHLDQKTGIIKIRSSGEHGEFDREIITTHYVTVEVRDNLGQGNRNTIQMILTIVDVNDNAPIFLERKYEAKLFENKMTFEMPVVVKAKDLDLHGTKNSEIIYDLMGAGNLNENFIINSQTGEISVKKPLDFEAINLATAKDSTVTILSSIKPIYLSVIARDMGTPSLSSKVTLIIYLHDLNDNSPEFKEDYYSASIPENLTGGIFILKVSAIDNDGSAPNNMIVYRIQKGASDKFVIGSDTGIISVAHGASLDPDLTDPKTTEYSLVVLALDGGIGDQQLHASTVVNITILDVNNKLPVFEEPGKITMLENTPVGTVLHQLIAYDLDVNPILRYYIDPTVSEARSEEGILIKQTEYDYINAFHLNPMTGVIKIVKLIDREKVEQIKLGVIVEDTAAGGGIDGDNRKQIAASFLTILIDDVNDNNPKFRKPFYKRSIAENSPNGITILNVAAYDIDKNRTITYSLEGPERTLDLIQIDTETGEIVVANKIDHELYEWLNYTVRAIDSGIPARSSLVDVFIRVVDENDNNPYFISESSNLTVRENSPIGTRIAMIRAKDADSGDFGKITFLIDKISSHGKFMIDADTGVLMVSDDIDREEKSSYMLVIEAWDNYQFDYLSGESRNAFKQFFIQIIDENDSPPILHYPKNTIQISEYHDVSEIVTHIKANDADDPMTPNGKVEFKIAAGTGKDLFMLIPRDPWNCDIYAKRSLHDFYGNYSLIVNARDLGTPQNNVEVELNISVLDFNDHAPRFVAPGNNVTVRVPENATIGTQIVQVRALDDDVGANAAVLYRLKQDQMGNYRTFSIDHMTGMITLKMLLDRERQKIYEIRIEAYDQGVPPLTTDLDLSIYVRNVNNYEPQFIVNEITVNFTEHEKPGIEKMKLPDTIDRDEVDDLDDPPSMVCYFIVFGNENGTFHLDPETHVLTVLKELDRELKQNHTLIIKATEDCIHPPENLTLPIEFGHENIMTYNSALTQQYPRRHDKPGTGSGIRSSSDYWFNRYKHSRSLRSVIDWDSSETIVEETISATTQMYDETNNIEDILNDNNEYPAEVEHLVSNIINLDNTLVPVIVYVQDINDNPPEFVSNIFTGGLTTAADFGTKVMNVRAIDKDDGSNAKLQYYQIGEIHRTLTEGLDHLSKPPFLMEKNTGAVILNFDPQKGMKGYFDFMISVNDTDGLQDSAHVFIYLLREDQRVKFVLRQQPSQIRDRIFKFRQVLSNVTNAIVNVDDFKIHENKDGSVDKTKTDLYLHLVDRRDNSILEVSDVLKMIDQKVEILDELFKEFNVLDTQPSEALLLTGSAPNSQILLWLIFANVFICTLLVVVVSLCFSQRKTYQRQLRAACVHSYASSPSDITVRTVTAATVPNTNKHSMQGSNPIWLKAYTNEWFQNDEDLSHTDDGVGGRVAGGDGDDTDREPGGPDSLDENVLVTEPYIIGGLAAKELNGFTTQNNLSPFNVYQQIDRMTANAQILTRKLETTEL